MIDLARLLDAITLSGTADEGAETTGQRLKSARSGAPIAPASSRGSTPRRARS
ncbi:MAG: hypothetical protein IPG50_27965 [Myxococcales bacterium]|nr:hypothetical protein [Myxococcales bacterium]